MRKSHLSNFMFSKNHIMYICQIHLDKTIALECCTLWCKGAVELGVSKLFGLDLSGHNDPLPEADYNDIQAVDSYVILQLAIYTPK